MQQQGLDLIDIIQKGAIATYPLILMSVISVAVVLERLWSLRNISSLTLRIAESLVEPLKKGQRDLAIVICKQSYDCPVGRIMLRILNHDTANRPETANASPLKRCSRKRSGLRRTCGFLARWPAARRSSACSVPWWASSNRLRAWRAE